MINSIVLMIMTFLPFNSALAHDAAFYSLHPVELQQALKQCPQAHPPGVSCEQLDRAATRANQLVNELHSSPQMFGQKILALQESIAQLDTELKKNHDVHLKASYDDNKMQLRQCLAIVKLLESPRG